VCLSQQVNVFDQGKTFHNVQSAQVRLIDRQLNKVLYRYSLRDCETEAIIVLRIYRYGPSLWRLRIIDEPAHGHTFNVLCKKSILGPYLGPQEPPLRRYLAQGIVQHATGLLLVWCITIEQPIDIVSCYLILIAHCNTRHMAACSLPCANQFQISARCKCDRVSVHLRCVCHTIEHSTRLGLGTHQGWLCIDLMQCRSNRVCTSRDVMCSGCAVFSNRFPMHCVDRLVDVGKAVRI
jgi:hypothetical protein